MKIITIFGLLISSLVASASTSTNKTDIQKALGYLTVQLENAVTYHQDMDYELELSDSGSVCFQMGQNKNQLRELLSDAEFINDSNVPENLKSDIIDFEPTFCKVIPSIITHEKVRESLKELIGLTKELSSTFKN
jgi:hypothetical protein